MTYPLIEDKFEQFKTEKESGIYSCLRGRLGEEDGPDIPTVDSAESLKEQFYWFSLGINQLPEKDGINWEQLEKELKACAEEVIKEWYERKKAERKRDILT